MRVTYPSVLDGLVCVDATCPCHRVRELAQPAAEPHPGRAALVLALDLPDAPLTHNPAPWTDFPLLATQTPGGVQLSFSTLCPRVRRCLVAASEPVTPAFAQDGWRQPLRVWHPDGKSAVDLVPGVPLPWPAFAALRDMLMELAAEPTLPVLGRLTRLTQLVEQTVYDRAVPTTPQPLTPRAFLQFRAFLESRTAAVVVDPLADLVVRARPFLTELDLQDSDLPRLVDALSGEWRDQLREWLVPVERDVTPVWQAWLGVRLLALPVDRDVSLARGWAELLETVAVALRYLAAWGEVRQAPVDRAVVAVALALAEALVASENKPLPPFVASREAHDRGPRMADLDLSVEAIC